MNHEEVRNEHKKHSFREVIILAVVISFVAGGVAGGLVGAAAGSLTNLVPSLFRTNLLSPTTQRATQSTQVIEEESQTIDVVKKASPAVVSIVGKQDLSKLYNLTGPQTPFDLFGFPTTPQQGTQKVNAGSGFLVSSDGLIVTNKHVVDQDLEYSVVTQDGTEHPARVLAKDPASDIALVKIDGTKFPIISFGDSRGLQIGQTVIAIGFALGQYQNTVTKGVVSGLGRTIDAGDGLSSTERLENVIQTDAAINRGNSGGPLLDLEGKVIGLNTAVDFQGQLIGFAIPTSVIVPAVESVEATGKIVRPFLGVRYVALTQEIAKANNLAYEYGAYVVRGQASSDVAVTAGSAADKAGIKEGDIILEFDGTKIDASHSLGSLIAQHKAGDTATLKVSSGGSVKDIKVTLGERQS